MNEAGEMGALAIPFAAGSAAGWFLTGTAGATASPLLPLAALSAVLLVLPAGFSGKGQPYICAGVFFLLGLFCQVSAALTAALPGGPPAIAARSCEALKRGIAAIPFPHGRSAALVQALLTGDRSGLDRATVTAFRASGASHILALSGLHLGLIYLLLRRAFGWIGHSPASKRIRSVLTVMTTGFYMLMTGAGPSIVRAWLYICFSEAAGHSPGRKKEPVRILLAALTVQLALKPAVIGSIGFQLSYLAMLGITVLYPPMRAWYPAPRSRLERADPMRRIWDAAALTISAQAFTAPLAWIRFHTLPKYFLLTNLLSLPLSSLVISVSVLTLCLSACGLCPPLLVRLDDALISLLLFVLETISAM
ncbi:MAG: ComEC/Rec2 family competence protein [Bacteroidales bacterium]|nr:ComEC/Rec2 family competence protein [Bacteroidales bacterium]